MQQAQNMVLSERRACRTIGQPRMTQRYQLKEPDRDKALTEQIKLLANKHKRYGYRMNLHVKVLLLRWAGQSVQRM